VGQAGIAMVMGLCGSIAYSAQPNGNRLILTFAGRSGDEP
jgi:hypothetical protein